MKLIIRKMTTTPLAYPKLFQRPPNEVARSRDATIGNSTVRRDVHLHKGNADHLPLLRPLPTTIAGLDSQNYKLLPLFRHYATDMSDCNSGLPYPGITRQHVDRRRNRKTGDDVTGVAARGGNNAVCCSEYTVRLAGQCGLPGWHAVPVAPTGTQRKAKPRVTRFLEDDLWQAVKTSIAAMPRDTAREQEHYARVRWLISLLYLMGLRISEGDQESRARSDNHHAGRLRGVSPRGARNED
jgi:hypothetical protein